MTIQRWWQTRTSRPLGVDVAAVLLLLISFAAFALAADVLRSATGWQLGVAIAAAVTGLAALVAFVPTADQRRFRLGFGVSLAAVATGVVAFVLLAPLDVSRLVVVGLIAAALLWANRHVFNG